MMMMRVYWAFNLVRCFAMLIEWTEDLCVGLNGCLADFPKHAHFHFRALIFVE